MLCFLFFKVAPVTSRGFLIPIVYRPEKDCMTADSMNRNFPTFNPLPYHRNERRDHAVILKELLSKKCRSFPAVR